MKESKLRNWNFAENYFCIKNFCFRQKLRCYEIIIANFKVYVGPMVSEPHSLHTFNINHEFFENISAGAVTFNSKTYLLLLLQAIWISDDGSFLFVRTLGHNVLWIIWAQSERLTIPLENWRSWSSYTQPKKIPPIQYEGAHMKICRKYSILNIDM